MNCLEVLAALALRRVVAPSPQPVGGPGGDGPAEDLLGRYPAQSLAAALRRAVSWTWVAARVVLAGNDLEERLRAHTENGRAALARECVGLRAAVSLDGLRRDPEALSRCREALENALQTEVLTAGELDLPALLRRGEEGAGTGAEEVSERERQDLQRLGEVLSRQGHAGLCPLLELRWRDRGPLLVVLVAAFFRYALSRLAGDEAGSSPVNGAAVVGGEDDLQELATALDHHWRDLPALLARSESRIEDRGSRIEEGKTSHSSSILDPRSSILAPRFLRGVTHLHQGEHDRAIAEFTAILRDDPDHPAALAQRGEALRLKGEYDRALADFDAAHRLDPGNARVLFNRGTVHWVVGQLEEAVTDFTAALAVDPKNVFAVINRGAVRVERGEHEAALEDFSRALQIDPACALAHQKRGDLLVRLGEPDRAIADYTRVLRLTPACVQTFLKRGDAYRGKGKADQAVADYSSALQYDPLNVTGYLARATIYQARGEHELALADLNQAAKLEPANSRIYQRRALTFRALKSYDRALADFDRACQLAPDDADLVYQRGCTHQLRGDLERALADLDLAILLKPTFARAYNDRGTIHFGRDEIDWGIDDFSAALRFDPRFVEALVNRANAWVKKGRFDRAVADCDRALEEEPGLVGAYLVRGSAHVQQGAYDAANADFARALEIDPDNAQAYHVRGLTAMNQGQYQKALADFTEVLRRQPNNARTLFLRGSVQQLLERHEEALADFNQAVLLDPQYTAAYCNQRALIHAGRGEYELALTDYAIVLQLDPTNVTALAGREQVLQAQQAQPKTPPKPPPARKPRARAGGKPAPRTEVIRVGKDTQTHPAAGDTQTGEAAAQPDSTAEAPPAAESTPSAEEEESGTLRIKEEDVEQTQEAPPVPGATAPDHAVEAPDPAAKTDTPAPAPPAAKTRDDVPKGPVGPHEKRAATEERQAEMSERARLWAEMRARERRTEVAKEIEPVKRAPRQPRNYGPLLYWVLRVTLVLVSLGGGGGGIFWFMTGESHVTATQVWEEYDKDTPGANQKYKGKFVLITGKVKIITDKQTARSFLVGSESGKWGIEFVLPKDKKDTIKDGQEVTLRCRFNQRKEPDGYLVLSNCTLVSVN
jgi:tetratricopeptide (TPR) repeat protein